MIQYFPCILNLLTWAFSFLSSYILLLLPFSIIILIELRSSRLTAGSFILWATLLNQGASFTVVHFPQLHSNSCNFFSKASFLLSCCVFVFWFWGVFVLFCFCCLLFVFGLAWVFTGLVHSVTFSLRSWVYLYFCVWKMMFL